MFKYRGLFLKKEKLLRSHLLLQILSKQQSIVTAQQTRAKCECFDKIQKNLAFWPKM